MTTTSSGFFVSSLVVVVVVVTAGWALWLSAAAGWLLAACAIADIEAAIDIRPVATSLNRLARLFGFDTSVCMVE
jgi:hypothetical protein